MIQLGTSSNAGIHRRGGFRHAAVETEDRLPDGEKQLLALCQALGAGEVQGVSARERELLIKLPPVDPQLTATFRQRIRNGHDPLGERFAELRAPAERRTMGATYTPLPLVRAMVSRAADYGTPARVVDPGTGSGRYLMVAGRRFRRASLIGVELDPVAAMIARANLATAGFADRARVLLADYREVQLGRVSGRTLYIGNPPYVRHHLLDQKWKQWLLDEASHRGLAASQLAGLHVHFFLATVLNASDDDFGAFITSAEWLDVNYGKLVRSLFVGPLGGRRIVVVEPTARPFPDAATTAAITYFQIGSASASIKLKRVESVEQVAEPNGGRSVQRARLIGESRWSRFTRPACEARAGYVELGELCHVHRGQVTGANRVWIAGPHSGELPASVLFPAVTRAKELFLAGTRLSDASLLRSVIDIPAELDALAPDARRMVEVFLEKAKAMGAHLGYVARNRKAWWSVSLRRPAPILATYMARRPPAFVRNGAEARHINIAHGLYPRVPLSEPVLDRLALFLARNISLMHGRTYAGGLTKFEPREMERLMVPTPELLAEEIADD